MKGRALIEGLKHVVEPAKRSTSFSEVKTAHRFLMWHLAHCPIGTDQQAVFELSLDFESSLVDFKRRFFGNTIPPMAMVLEAIPYSPVIKPIGVPRDNFEIYFHDPIIDLEHGLMIAPVPTYSSFYFDTQAGHDLESTYRHMGLSMICRNRSIGRVTNGILDDWLMTQPREMVRQMRKTGECAHMFILPNRTGSGCTGIVFYYVKNNWPVGYASMTFDNRHTANFFFHIFQEMTGTESSSLFFRASIQAAYKKLGISRILFMHNEQINIPPEEEAQNMAFYARHGFIRRDDLDIMLLDYSPS